MNISEKITTLMARHGLTQSALAELAGVSQAAVNGWCSGAKPRPDAIERIGKIFDISIDYLVSDSIPLPEWIPPLRFATKNTSTDVSKTLLKISTQLSVAASALDDLSKSLLEIANAESDKKNPR